MRNYAFVVFVYAFLVFVGGLIGFIKAASMPSLITGTLFGIGLLAAAIGMYSGSLMSLYLALAIAFLLTIFFCYRFTLTQAFMPGGLMAILSAIVLIILVYYLFKQ